MTMKTPEQVAREMFPASTPTQDAMRVVAKNAIEADRAQRETPGDLTLKDISEGVTDLLAGLSEDHVRTVIRAALTERGMVARFFGPDDLRATLRGDSDTFGGITEAEIERSVEAAQDLVEWGRLTEKTDVDQALVRFAAHRAAIAVMRETIGDINLNQK